MGIKESRLEKVMPNIDKLFISEEAVLTDALRQLGESNGIPLLVVNENRKLLAVLSDGDIRRHLLKTQSTDATVKDIANYKPKFLRCSEKENAKQVFGKYQINIVPIVDENGIVVDVVLRDMLIKTQRDTLSCPVVIMAGGLGTRLYPYTKILPKPLIPIGDIPICEHIINGFRSYGCNKFYLVVNHKKNMIKAYFNEIEKDYEVEYADENIPLGTAGGLSYLREKIKGTFIFTNCDTLITDDYSAIMKKHLENKNAITMICSLKTYTIPYGVVVTNENGEIVEMKEKPKYSYFTNTGTYIVDSCVLDLIEYEEKIGFPDVIARAKEKGLKVGVYPIGEDAWMDMGQFDTMEEMRKRIEG